MDRRGEEDFSMKKVRLIDSNKNNFRDPCECGEKKLKDSCFCKECFLLVSTRNKEIFKNFHKGADLPPRMRTRKGER